MHRKKTVIREDYKQGWRQHFPTYHFNDRDIALQEYECAARNLEAEERVFLNASNISLVSSAALGSLVVGFSENLTNSLSSLLPSIFVPSALIFLLLSYSYVTLRYFADRQRAITYSSRKVIVLRRMLGLSYGRVQLLLPNWRVEGADEPLAIRAFPGWGTYVAYPFWMITITSSVALFFLASYLIIGTPKLSEIKLSLYLPFLTSIFWLIFLSISYRLSLLDIHESARLLVYRNISKAIHLGIPGNFEYIIYRAKLSAYENSRLKINTEKLSSMLVQIEDRNFYKHAGISYKALLRSSLSLLGIKRRSGGSTITQQLIRSLFIIDMTKSKRRKFIELGLAPWWNSAFTKKDTIEIYLASVRFEKGVYGVVAAMQHFWGKIVDTPSAAQAFFLIERVSNIRSKILPNKVIETARSAVDCNLLQPSDILELVELYREAAESGTILATASDLLKLEDGLSRN